MNNNELKIGTFNLGHSSLIEASAGTGKTYTITYLVLRLLLGSKGSDEKGAEVKEDYGYHSGPLELKNILVVTFTNAATSDLRARIREKIVAARIAFEKVAKKGMEVLDTLEIEDQLKALIHEMIDIRGAEARTCALLLLNAERSIDDAPICTIHSFCTSALHKVYTFEAGEPFDVELCQDISDQTEEARNTVWRELFYKGDANSEKLAALLSVDSDEKLFSTLSKYQEKLGRVRNTDSKEGFFGYNLLNNKVKACSDIRKTLSKVIGFLDGYLDEFSILADRCRSIFDEYKGKVITDDNQPGELFTKTKGVPPKFTIKSLSAYMLLRDICNTHDDKARRLAFIRGNFSIEKDFTSIYKVTKRDSYVDTFKNYEKIIEIEDLFMQMSSLHNKVISFKDEILFDIAIMVEQKLDEILERDHLIGLDGIIRRLDYVLNYKEGSKDILPGLIRAAYPVAMIDEFQDTDPVQFSIFSKLYLNENAKKTGACCYLIGDPKQSIYGFRKADIHSYLKARALIESLYGSDSIYTLSTNFRSQKQIVEGVNTVFTLREEPFFFDKNSKDNIEFSEVKAKVKSLGNSGKCSFRFCNVDSPVDNFSAASNYVEFLSEAEIMNAFPNSKSVGKTNSREFISKKLARTVQLCLSHGVLDSVSGDKVTSRAVKPSDISILVSIGDEAKLLQSALKELNISSVYYSDKSKVFDESSSDNSFAEYELLLYLIDAMDDYANRGKVKTLLLSQLCSASENENLEALGDAIELEVSLLKECRLIWEKNGFFPAFSKWASDERHQCLKDNLRFTGGERMVTNLWHLAELLQSARAHEQGIQAQKRWYFELRTNTSLNTDADMFKKRLESEASQVAIYTIFKSKGLEFPLVFMPYLWSDMRAINKVEPYYYDDSKGKLYFDIQALKSTLEQKAKSDLQEDARLLYVALTRACAANFIYIPQWKMDNPNALVSEFIEPGNSSASAFSKAELVIKGEALSSDEKTSDIDSSCLKGNPFKLVDEDFYAEVLKSEPVFEDNAPKSRVTGPSEFSESFKGIRQDYRISSYSGIVARSEDGGTVHKNDDLVIPKDSFTRFNFPRNAIAGTYLHSIMEYCDFSNCTEESGISSAVEKASHTNEAGILKRWYINHMSPDKDEVLVQKHKTLNGWLADIVGAQMPCADSKTVRLCDLKKGDWLSELEFLFPSDKFSSGKLEELRKENAEVFAREKGISLDDINFSLAQSELSGFVKGFIDLAIKVGDGADSKFYVIDYKSNFMGISYEDYDEKSVSLNMLEHCYDVQYLFYSLAMHRFLQNRIENYDYDRHFGGIIYLYLRGMQKGSSNSIVYTRPKFELIEKLSRIFSE
ncbi:MAG: UvrD-helicase domain-containing protein [Succinivibrio sp.]|nr:UvrD-helicase domain-containing protein [Succinivibrio sp.]